MPLNKRPIIPEIAWPDACPEGRRLMLKNESLLDYRDQSKSYKRRQEVEVEREANLAELQRHYAVCGTCIDHAARAQQRLRARARTARALSRRRPGRRRGEGAGAADQPGLLRPPGRTAGGPEDHPTIRYAVERLEGAVVGVRAVEPGADSGTRAGTSPGARRAPGGVRPARPRADSTEAGEPQRSERTAPARRRRFVPR